MTTHHSQEREREKTAMFILVAREKTSKLKKLTISLCLLSSTCHNSCRPACQKHTPYGSIDVSRPSAFPTLFFNYPIYFYSLPNNCHHLYATCSFCACYDYCILNGANCCYLFIANTICYYKNITPINYVLIHNSACLS